MHIRAVLAAAVLALAMTACGGSSDEEDKETTTQSSAPTIASSTAADPEEDREALRQAVETLAAARVVGDPDQITALFSDYCQHRLIVGAFAKYLQVREFGYSPHPKLSSFTATVDGETAHVTYRFAEAPRLGARQEKWYLQDDEWRQDACFS